MAWVETYTGKTRTSYRVFRRDPDGTKRWRTFAQRREADAFARSVEVDKDRGTYTDPRKGRVLFGEFFAEFIEDAREKGTLKPSSLSLYRNTAERYLLPTHTEDRC